MANDERTRWFWALGYVAFIYATLEVIWIPFQMLRTHGLLRLTLGLIYAGCFFMITRGLVNRGVRNARPYLIVVGVFIAYFIIAGRVSRLEEQLHFFEYGLVGVLFARALEKRARSGVLVYTGAFVLAVLAGIIDEKLQGLLPHRTSSVQDIVLNVISAGLGLLVYNLFPKRASSPTLTWR